MTLKPVKNIIFDIPPKRETLRINLSLSEEIYKKIKVIQYQHDINMTQAIEMLIMAALPEYFRQYPLEDHVEEEIYLLSEGERDLLCKNKGCNTPFAHNKKKFMVKVNNEFWCKRCYEKSKICIACGKHIDGEAVDTEDDEGKIDYYHDVCFKKTIDTTHEGTVQPV